MKESYFWTHNQKKLLRLKLNKNNENLNEYMKKIIFNHLLIENGTVERKEDYLLDKDINNTFIEYILNTSSERFGELDKYNVSYYYTELAKRFNRIALKRKISRNNLWNMIKENIIFKKSNKTELRIYKYIFRGELIPSPRYVQKRLERDEDLPTYLSIIYLDEAITPKLDIAYKKLKAY
ncbi:Hypothetical protein NATL1_08801 [Prochlorococcus marinus str. NATL1A]|uniref:Uncharacterized protein n=1 Tax=Prochlorococcus marinus (strain NATL1A) TaxID=167555 RepID=A2C1S8_PROM1|nr:hypothetical protein [Prochlorococcus marinus]ABM75438.1 Hypothetical protein NATL1_08801 [Prochlorococcus marinus str. NATL1A]